MVKRASAAPALTHDIAGGAAGLDYQFTPDILFGFAAGGSSSNFSVRDRITSGHLEAGHFGGYGVKTWGSFYTAGALSFNTYRNDTSRTIAGVGPIETATGNFGSNMWSGRLELGYKAQTLPSLFRYAVRGCAVFRAAAERLH